MGKTEEFAVIMRGGVFHNMLDRLIADGDDRVTRDGEDYLVAGIGRIRLHERGFPVIPAESVFIRGSVS